MNPTAAVDDDSCHQGISMPDAAVGDLSVPAFVRYAKRVVLCNVVKSHITATRSGKYSFSGVPAEPLSLLVVIE